MLAFSLTACKGGDTEKKTEVNVTVRNITGVAISELYIQPEAFGNYGSNRLTENFPDNSDLQLTLGEYTAAETEDGYALQATSAEDGTYETFGNLMLKSGDTVTFYIDALGLALAVNTSDEEIQEMIDELAEDIKNSTIPAEETTTE